MEILISVLTLFILPLFPISILVNKFIFKLEAKKQIILVFLFFASGIFLLEKIPHIKDNHLVVLVSLLSAAFYTFRLLSVESVSRYLLFLYVILSSFAWLCKSIGLGMTIYLFLFMPAFIVFMAMVWFLVNRFGVVHDKIISGLGSVMPKFSLLFVSALFLIQNIPVMIIMELFKKQVAGTWYIVIIVLAVIWIFVNWAGVRLIEQIIFLKPVRRFRYKDISFVQVVLASMVLVFEIVYTIYFLGRNAV